GLESITMLQNDLNKTNLFKPWLMKHKRTDYMPMGLTAGVVAERYKVSRESQDEYALLSQQRTAAAQKSGRLREEIAPMTVTMEVTDKATGAKSQKQVTVDRDECNRPDTTLEGLAKLPPAFKEGGTVTAGNSSQFSDGASATLILSANRAQAHGLDPARAAAPEEALRHRHHVRRRRDGRGRTVRSGTLTGGEALHCRKEEPCRRASTR